MNTDNITMKVRGRKSSILLPASLYRFFLAGHLTKVLNLLQFHQTIGNNRPRIIINYISSPTSNNRNIKNKCGEEFGGQF